MNNCFVFYSSRPDCVHFFPTHQLLTDLWQAWITWWRTEFISWSRAAPEARKPSFKTHYSVLVCVQTEWMNILPVRSSRHSCSALLWSWTHFQASMADNVQVLVNNVVGPHQSFFHMHLAQLPMFEFSACWLISQFCLTLGWTVKWQSAQWRSRFTAWPNPSVIAASVTHRCGTNDKSIEQLQLQIETFLPGLDPPNSLLNVTSSKDLRLYPRLRFLIGFEAWLRACVFRDWLFQEIQYVVNYCVRCK